MFNGLTKLTSYVAARTLRQSKCSGHNVCLMTKRSAGHSKWANIKHTKMLKDGIKSTTYHKLSQKIRLAVKEGGDNPATNVKLKNALEEARSQSMPNSTIESAIKSAKASGKLQWIIYAAPNGLNVGFEVNAVNYSHAVGKLNQFCKRINLKHEKNLYDFCTERGIIVTNGDGGYDKAVEDAIESGIEEVTEIEEGSLLFECIPTHLENASKKLAERGYDIQSSTSELTFHKQIKLSDSEKEALSSVIERLETNMDDFVRAVDNVNRQ